MSREAWAEACSNVALVKYWGKRDVERNLPSRGSISVTLGDLTTKTHVRYEPDLEHDVLTVDGIEREGAAQARANLAAAPNPAIPGTLSVPERRPNSWPPPRTCGCRGVGAGRRRT